MDKKQILENIRVKADLRYDLLFESSYYSTLDKETANFLKENYDRGVSLGLDILKSNPNLINEDIDEGFFDRLKATGARAVQGVKNVTGIGTQTADSKDAAVNSLFNNFKAKFDKTPGGAAPATAPVAATPAQGGQGGEQPAQKIGAEVEELDQKTQNLPPVAPQQAAAIVDKANVPKSFKDKLKAAIINNPKKTRFILAGLAMAAGAAGTMVGIPPQISGAVVNGIGSAIVNKVQGKSALAGAIQGGLSGMALGGLGAGISNALGSAAEFAVTKAAGAAASGAALPLPEKPFTPTDAGEDAALQAAKDAEYQQMIARQQAAQGYSPESPVVEPQTAPEDLATTEKVPNYDGGPQPSSGDFATPNRAEIPQTPQIQARSADMASAAEPQWTKTSRATNYGMGAEKGAQALGRLRRGSTFEENKNLFNKIGNNKFKLKRDVINEALSADQNAIIQDFLKDLGKTLNQSPEGVVQFMKSQGDRFKHILDYLPSDAGGNRNLTPQAGQQPGQQDQQPGQPGQIAAANPKLAKHVNAIKASPLFTGDLASRIANVVDVKQDDQKGMQALKVFLKSINGIISTQAGNVRKQIGDPSAILGTLKEDADIKGLSDLSKQIVGVMPSILGLAFELRQSLSKKNPNAVQPQQQGQLSEADGGLTSQQIGVIKAFLSQLVNVGLTVKNTDPAQADAVKLKNLFRTVLTLGNIVVNKNISGVKINPKIDKAFQGKDLVGPDGGDKKPTQVKKGPGDIFKENRYKLEDYKKFF